MTLQWINHQGNRRLILIFLGWGADAAAISQLTHHGYDILAVYDYRFESTRLPLDRYSEVCVLAWSFGVMEAARILGPWLPTNITLLLAINGTTNPVDDSHGIPTAIFQGTLQNLNERNLRKFYRRMFADVESWHTFSSNIPQRALDELIDELTILGLRASQPIPHLPWTQAFVSDQDAIFPPANQLRHWQSMDVPTRPLPYAGHFPDWQSLIDQTIIDKEHVALRFTDTAQTYDDEAKMQLQAATHLWEITRPQIQHTSLRDVLEIGCGTGLLTRLCIQSIAPTDLMLWDIAPIASDLINDCYNTNINTRFKQCDAETELKFLPPNSLDLVISSSTVQWFHSPAGFIHDAAKALRRGGLLAFSTYGPQTCRELSAAGIDTRHYHDFDAPIWLPSNSDLELIHKEEAIITTQFDSPREVFLHLRRSGVNALRREPLSAAAMRQALKSYPLDSQRKAPLTFNPLYFIYRKL